MNLELLRTFLEVERLRHFGKTALALHVTQAAVSARIQQLESMLGVSLFDRSKRDIRLTPAGARLKRYAENMIAVWRKARQDVAVGGTLLQLAVGGSLRLWDVLLQDWLHDVKRGHPQLALIAESHTPEVLTRRLLDGLLDVAFMLEPAQLEVLNIVEVATVELQLVSTRANHDIESALEDGYVMVDWGLSQALEHRRSFPDAPEPKTRVGQAKMALALLRELGGAAYLPERMIADDVKQGTLHVIQNAPRMGLKAHAVYPVRSGREPLILDVLKYFRAPPPAVHA